MRARSLSAIIVSVLLFQPAAADSLSLIGTDYFGTADEPQEVPLRLASLVLDVEAQGSFVHTTVEAVFENPTDEELSADFTLALPRDAVVTGYALDIDGKMVAGEILEKRIAREVIEDRIREGIDPGLGEQTVRNEFHTTVFPILPNGNRTIGVTFVAPVSRSQPYVLPLHTTETVGNVELSVVADDTDYDVRRPRALASAESTDIALDGEVSISMDNAPSAMVEVMEDGERMVAVPLPGPARSASSRPIETLHVFWDTSLSRRSTAAAEREILLGLIKRLKRSDVRLTFFNETLGEVVGGSGVAAATAAVRYHGATRLSEVLDAASEVDSDDTCLVFTDGRLTLGREVSPIPNCRLFTLSSDAAANRDLLSYYAGRGEGRFIDLRYTGVKELFDAITSQRRPFPVVRIDDSEIAARVHAINFGDQVVVTFAVSTDAQDVTVEAGSNSATLNLQELPQTQQRMISPFWATREFATMRGLGESRDAIVAASRKWRVATDETSFVVFEELEDYVYNEIPLPKKGFSKEQHLEYAELLEEYREDEELEAESWSDELASAWSELIEWYETDFPLKPIEPEVRPSPPSRETDVDSGSVAVSVVTAEELENSQVGDVHNLQHGLVEEIIVAAMKRESPGPMTAIEMSEWSPDRPYLKALENKCYETFKAEYFEQLDANHDIPAFYLDASDAASRCGDFSFAEQIVLSALELDTADMGTTKAVANRLLRMRSDVLALQLFQQIADTEPDRAQSWRDLAIAKATLAQRSGTSHEDQVTWYQEALAHFEEIIASPSIFWEAGVTLIAVMEANWVIAQLERLGITVQLDDERLNRLLDVDIRILLNWNVDNTDMDLWVTEPSGETAKFNNNRTRLGGRLSNDVVDGFGPEEYLLRNVVPGTYEIRVDYYGSDIINPNGAVVVRAEVIRNWGRLTEMREVIDIEFTSDEEKEYLVGKIVVAE